RSKKSFLGSAVYLLFSAGFGFAGSNFRYRLARGKAERNWQPGFPDDALPQLTGPFPAPEIFVHAGNIEVMLINTRLFHDRRTFFYDLRYRARILGIQIVVAAHYQRFRA